MLFLPAAILFVAATTAAEKKVLIIGVDGAGGRYVREANTPTLDSLAATGAARYDFLNEAALAPNPPSGYGASGVNWSTILTGVSAAHHGVVDNTFAGSNFDTYPHFFELAKRFRNDLFTVSLANWTPINTEITPDAYADIEIGYDSGSYEQQDIQVKNDAVALLSSTNPTAQPDAIFLHFDQVDGAGHTYSWGSPQHLTAIENVDTLIGDVLKTMNQRPGVLNHQEDWLVLVTADHGAKRGEFSHYASQGPENWETPFIASGPSVLTGAELAQGTLRDVAATALWHLGVDPIAAGVDGTVRGLVYSPIGDLDRNGFLNVSDWAAFLQRANVPLTGDRLTDYLLGDVNLDGKRTLSDAVYFRSLFELRNGVTLEAALARAPEPSAATLILVTLTTTRLALLRRHHA